MVMQQSSYLEDLDGDGYVEVGSQLSFKPDDTDGDGLLIF
jgi:hypothetical protein